MVNFAQLAVKSFWSWQHGFYTLYTGYKMYRILLALSSRLGNMLKETHTFMSSSPPPPAISTSQRQQQMGDPMTTRMPDITFAPMRGIYLRLK
jgi:hypothetical protein